MTAIAIVGSQEYEDEFKVRQFVRYLFYSPIFNINGDVEIVSGGAPGPDSWAEDEGRKLGIDLNIHYAQWKLYGKAAGPMRNQLIVNDSDIIIAFYDGKSRGTRDTISKALASRKPVIVVLKEDKAPTELEMMDKMFPQQMFPA